jgi:hypothetical protein
MMCLVYEMCEHRGSTNRLSRYLYIRLRWTSLRLLLLLLLALLLLNLVVCKRGHN